MKVLGIVQWTDRDKHGSPIAGVRPIIEIQKDIWRVIDAAEEYPSQGQVFWPNAAAPDNSLVIFRPQTNIGHKDEFRVAEYKPVYEVLDLRRYGTAPDVRAALAAGVLQTGAVGNMRSLIWCQPGMLVGPVELSREATGMLKLNGANLARVPSYGGDVTQVRSISVDNAIRWLRIDDGPPVGYVDWDDDTAVLRRAVDYAVQAAKKAGRDPGLTKKQIEETAKELASLGVGPDIQLARYRIDRALVLLKNTDAVARNADDFADLLREHPAIKTSLEALSEKVKTDVEHNIRAEIEQQLTQERAAQKEAAEALARTKLQLEAAEQKVQETEDRLLEIQSRVANLAMDAEAAMKARLVAAIERPMEILAEVSVLRPFLMASGSRSASTPLSAPPRMLDWSRARGEPIRDKASLRSALTRAARARGVDPAMMLQIHAATAAHLMPVTLGAGAFAALSAYAYGACAGRLLIVHVSPSAINPHDFDEMQGGGLVAAVAAAKEIDGVSIVVLEGANRSPLEASVVPILELANIGLPPFAPGTGLRLAASLVVGATTVPVTPQLWSHAVAIHLEPTSPATQTASLGDISLSSELFALGDEPKEVIDALLEAWPECSELRPAMSRLGSALTRLYDDEPRVSDSLLHGLLLPYIVTALNDEEQAEALGSAGDTDGSIALRLRRLRRRLV